MLSEELTAGGCGGGDVATGRRRMGAWDERESCTKKRVASEQTNEGQATRRGEAGVVVGRDSAGEG